jgi:hypothetical protein
MANSYSAGKSVLVEPPAGSYTNGWAIPLNSNFSVIGATISGTTTIDASTLTPGVPFAVLAFQNFDQNSSPQTNPLAGQNIRIRVTGALSFNVSVLIPAGYPGFWIIDNKTTGNFNLTIKSTDPVSVGVQPEQGFMSTVFCDGVNVSYSDMGTVQVALSVYTAQHIIPGTIILFGSTTVQTGYLLCNGAAVSRTTYADLFAKIGTTWGSGDGSTTFNVPSLTFATPPATYMIKT